MSLQSEYIPETKITPDNPADVSSSSLTSGSVKIEEEIRTNEPIANNVDMPIDEILSNSKKCNHLPKYVIRPVPKIDQDDLDKELQKRSTTLVPVFKFLSPEDLKNCSLVCKDWYTATINPALWVRMDFTETVITSKLIKCEYIIKMQLLRRCLNLCQAVFLFGGYIEKLLSVMNYLGKFQ